MVINVMSLIKKFETNGQHFESTCEILEFVSQPVVLADLWSDSGAETARARARPSPEIIGTLGENCSSPLLFAAIIPGETIAAGKSKHLPGHCVAVSRGMEGYKGCALCPVCPSYPRVFRSLSRLAARFIVFAEQ